MCALLRELKPMRLKFWAIGIALMAAGGGCTTASKRTAVPVSAAEKAIDEAAIAALYERIGEATSSFQGGLELMRAGSPRNGRERLGQALESLETAAGDCARTPGCENQRFVAAFTVLIRLQGVAAGWEQLDDEAPSALISEAEQAPALPASSSNASRGSAPLLRDRDLRKLIVLNEPVRAAIEDWLTWMRPQLIETWVNYGYLRAQMAPAYERAGLPEALLFGFLAKESAGRVHSFSRAGAAGPLQFMPDTAKRFGLGSINGRDGRMDPAAAVQANVVYMEEQLRAFDNNLELSLAAYNSGESRMRRLAKQYPGKGFWSDRIYFALPPETRDYVPKVLAAAYLFLHPQEYGLSFPTIDPRVGNLALLSDLSLGELAMCLGQEQRAEGWFRTLRNLNPQLASDQRLPAGSRVRVPQGLLAVYAERCRSPEQLAKFAKLQDARHPEGPTQVGYAVRRGDTLHAIARRSRCSNVDEIGRLNGLKGPRYTLRVGQQIRLPTCS